jgi:hypothetical protein
MKFGFKTTALIIFAFAIVSLSPNALYAEEIQKEIKTEANVEELSIKNYVTVEPLDLVNNPDDFMDKDIKIQAQFHKFSTLGLDYDKALRDSKDYISILIKRPDVVQKYTIPLSELKLIIKREAAEELLDMESGDMVEITGKVFSSALNDPWVDVYKLTSLEPEEEDKKNSEKKAELKE